MSLSERLRIINCILFWYTEDYFLSPVIENDILFNLKGDAMSLQEMCKNNPEQAKKTAIEDYDLRRETYMPNILSKDYCFQRS